ncbi:hypothetical protein Q7P37_011267 [Cladosporium fusiforme]
MNPTTKVKETSMSTIISPVFIPTHQNQLILLSPGHHTPGWLTHIARLLNKTDPSAALNDARNAPLLVHFLTHRALLKECRDFERVLPSTAWSAEDEEKKRKSETQHFVENPAREVEVAELVRDWKQRGFALEGFEERAAWGLRAVRVGGPFEIRVDDGGHEFVVEVGKLGEGGVGG